MKKILVIDSGKTFSPTSQEMFRINGYDIEIFDDIHKALHCYRANGDQPSAPNFDLILASVDSRLGQVLEREHLAGKIDRLVLLQNNLFCRDYYCSNRRIAVICNVKQVFNCLNDMLQAAAS